MVHFVVKMHELIDVCFPSTTSQVQSARPPLTLGAINISQGVHIWRLLIKKVTSVNGRISISKIYIVNSSRSRGITVHSCNLHINGKSTMCRMYKRGVYIAILDYRRAASWIIRETNPLNVIGLLSLWLRSWCPCIQSFVCLKNRYLNRSEKISN